MLQAKTPDDCVVEAQTYVLGPLWSAQQAEDAAYELKRALETSWGLRAAY